jgi:hypothetical protein
MTVFRADWSGLWPLFIILFAVVPAIRWGVRGRGGWRDGTWEDHWGRSGGRRRRSPGSSRDIAAFRAEFEGRLSEVESLQTRVAELENRLDFTERLLAHHREGLVTPNRVVPARSASGS